MTNEDCHQCDKTTFMQLGPLLLFPPHSGNCHSLYLLSLTPQIIYPSLPQSLIPYIPYVPSLRPLSERGISLTVYVAPGCVEDGAWTLWENCSVAAYFWQLLTQHKPPTAPS
jgi:hypothetical protein